VSTLVHANKNPELSRGGGLSSILNRTSVRGTGTTSAGYPDSSLKPLSCVLPEENRVYPVQSYESVSVLGNP
jgi:hypothetical protein